MMANLRALLRGDQREGLRFLAASAWHCPGVCALVVLAGSGVYGITVGLWRSPEQAFYTAIKIPALILLTCAGNAVLNGMLAQLLGSALSFRQTSAAILLGFAVASAILGTFAPIALFVLFNTPALSAVNALTGHSVMLLTHVCLIACAGILGNRLLFRSLNLLNTPEISRRVLMGWLAGNLLLGSQLAWMLRPFIGSPNLSVQFLRPDFLHGNFFEAVARAIAHLLSQH
jgi:hypothetical protein